MFSESRILFRGTSISIGQFRCRPKSELWRQDNCTGDWPIVVFPRTAVSIHQANRNPVVATPNQVMLYNANHVYQRRLIDARGDACEFYGINPTLIAEIAESVGHVSKQLETPFMFSHAPCPSDIYLSQRAIFSLVKSGKFDPLFVEESFLGILRRLIEGQFRFHSRGLRPRKNDETSHREQVEAAKEFMAREFANALNLETIAAAVGCSVFHLCRIFKRRTGQSIHAFLIQLRLRSSIERLLDGNQSLTGVALDLSFSSHSHFTNSFRKSFGVPPKLLRKNDMTTFINLR